MGNELLTPPEVEAAKAVGAADKEPELLIEADGSMWSSLIANLRDAFSSPKQPPLELTSHAVAVRDPLQQEPIWKEMVGTLQDAFFPRKLPPLELTSTPIPTRDLLYEKRGPLPLLLSILTYAVIIGAIAVILYKKIVPTEKKPAVVATNVDISPALPIAPKKKLNMGGGGGGGDHDLVEVSKGKLPKFSKQEIAPPQIQRFDKPKLAVEPTVLMPQNIKIPDANMPNLGLPSSTQVTVASNGTGSHGGMGSGENGGLGSGNGGGIGPGSGGGYGGGVYQVGGGVSPPVPIYEVDPEFSDEARRAKYQGVVLLSFIIDAQGNPQHIRVSRPVGMGLDEKAVEALKQYKFKPAMLNGKPVPVNMSIEVNFRMY